MSLAPGKRSRLLDKITTRDADAAVATPKSAPKRAAKRVAAVVKKAVSRK